MPDTEIFDKKILLDHLSAQYRLYREEVRIYLGFAVASVSLLLFVFMGELNAAKDNPRIIIFIPLTSVSYVALLGLLYSYTTIAAHYSALIEKKINALLEIPVYIFEHYYVGPKPKRGESLPFFLIFLLTATMPVAFTVYAIFKLWHDPKISSGLFYAITLFTMFASIAVLWAFNKIIILREKMNIQLFQDWQSDKNLVLYKTDNPSNIRDLFMDQSLPK